ncbi:MULTISPECIES: alpha/beta hydrolase [Acinetobacter]|uniref:alpha/beta hydrolase n=1 Tax=Acinetobacter TaxID=469 RepID=UPI0012504073|nr:MULTISPECIES: alpha/beta hydrolase [Acinetobacter]MBJ9372877.1 alpha/beta hydrolase [Acinetobacter sp. TGL-Y2]
MTTQIPQYQADILGAGYEQLTLNFPDDYDGKVTATLVRKQAAQSTQKAVLYIHGFIDYFFQTEMAEQFNQHGYDFYALDLRKYGRSHLPHQKYYYVLNLSEYDAEIAQALEIIGQEGHTEIVLAGHSTGGLIATLYAAHNPKHPLLHALWCNSPFYDFNMPSWKKKLALPRLSALGKHLPNLKFPSELNKWYVTSLHQDLQGEWNFSLEWKKKTYPKVYLSFVHAIFEAQKEIHHGVRLNIPSLIMHSHKTTYPKKFNQDAQSTDVILEVKDIIKYANKIQGDVNVMTIQNGLHDLVLSAPPVRAEVYQQLFAWLTQKQS